MWLGEVVGVVRTMFTKDSWLVASSLVPVGWQLCNVCV